MNKIILIIFGVILILTSCSSSINNNQSSTIESENISSECLNKKIIKIGMKYDEVLLIISDLSHLTYLNYLFYVDIDGKNNIIKFNSESNSVEEIEAFKHVETTKDAFANIIPGMTLYEVIKTVGMPVRSVTSGLSTLDFECKNENIIYRIVWDVDMKVIDVQKIS